MVRTYELENHHLKLLQGAAECLDRIVDSREALAEHGLTYVDRYGQPKERPECMTERQNKALFMRLLRELALDINTSDSRPPALY